MKHYTPEKKVRALRLRNEGWPMSEIAIKIGMSTDTIDRFFKRARAMGIDSEPSTRSADAASLFPASLFLDSTGHSKQRVKVGEYLTYKIWEAMQEDESIRSTQVKKELPGLADVTLRVVQSLMTKLKKNKRCRPQPPKPLLFKEMPLLATLKWSKLQLDSGYDVPQLAEVMELVKAAMKGPHKDRRGIGRQLLRDIPSFLVDKMDREKNTE